MKFFALVALALVASANAGAVTSFASVTRAGTLATGATMAQAGNMVITFRPATALVNNDDIEFTSTRAVFAADGDTGCTIKSNGADVTVTSADVSGGAGKVLKVKVGAALSKDHDAVITCTKNFAALGAAGAETFNLKTTKDTTDKVCAAPYTVNNGKATWTSAARSHLGATQTTGNLVIKFTTKNAIAADGTSKATASGAIFAADGGATTCTATCDGTANVVKSTTVADTKTSVEVKLTDACAAAKAVVATCTGNLVNPAAGAITFGFVTSADIVALTGQTGFTTTTATSASWTSAARATSVVSGAAGGNLVVKFTPWAEVAAGGTVTITPSANIFTADAATTCTATSDGTAVAVTDADTKSAGAVLTVKMTAKLAAQKAVVITCTDNLKVNGAAGAITFSLVTSGDATALTGQTGYTITAAPTPTKAPTKAPTNATAGGNTTATTKAPTKAATVAAASTDGVNAGLAFTALCLAFTALRQ